MKLLEGKQASIAPCNSFVMLDPRTRTQIMHGEVLKKKLLKLANKFVLCNKTREDGEE